MGHSVVLMDRWTAEGALERIERYRVTTSHMVPTMFNRLLQLPEDVRSRYDVSSLRSMVHAAAPCPVETKRRMIDWWGRLHLGVLRGHRGRRHRRSRPRSGWSAPARSARPGPAAKSSWSTRTATTCRPGESGTVYMKMPGAVFEYKGDEAKTAASRLRGFFTVGDVGYLDSGGYLFLNDRANDMIIVGGVNIYPAEIEGELVQHPAVGDAAVFGVPNPDTGEEIKAVVELREGWEPG